MMIRHLLPVTVVVTMIHPKKVDEADEEEKRIRRKYTRKGSIRSDTRRMEVEMIQRMTMMTVNIVANANVVVRKAKRNPNHRGTLTAVVTAKAS
jgi:hypothetical protein